MIFYNNNNNKPKKIDGVSWTILLCVDECTKTAIPEVVCDFLNRNAVSENSVIRFLKFFVVFLTHRFRAGTSHIIKKSALIFWISMYILQNCYQYCVPFWNFQQKQEWLFLYTHLIYFNSLSHSFYEEKFYFKQQPRSSHGLLTM